MVMDWVPVHALWSAPTRRPLVMSLTNDTYHIIHVAIHRGQCTYEQRRADAPEGGRW